MNRKAKRSVAGAYTMSERKFSAVSLVEGLHLNATSKSRIESMTTRGLSHDEQRREVIQAYSKKSR